MSSSNSTAKNSLSAELLSAVAQHDRPVSASPVIFRLGCIVVILLVAIVALAVFNVATGTEVRKSSGYIMLDNTTMKKLLEKDYTNKQRDLAIIALSLLGTVLAIPVAHSLSPAGDGK